MTVRDRESLIRGYERELAAVGDDKARAEAIKAEIGRVRALPPLPISGTVDATPAERESARARAYIEALRKERSRASEADHKKRIDDEISRVEGGLGVPKAERAIEVPKAERAVTKP